MQVARKSNGRVRGTFYGNDRGDWKYSETHPWGIRSQGWDWEALIGLDSENDFRNLSVDGATENHRGFRKALNEMVRQYPEILEWKIKFDGPLLPVSKLVSSGGLRELGWARMKFFHGTSSHVLDKILREGLRPRSETNVEPAYGVASGTASGRKEAVYLTTQMNMARMAARDAARRKGEPVVLEITGIQPQLVAPDEDSGEDTARGSLERLGSIAYLGTIPPRNISIIDW